MTVLTLGAEKMRFSIAMAVMTRCLQISKSVNEKERYQASSRSNGHVKNQKLDTIG